jgi:hypothetical protein
MTERPDPQAAPRTEAGKRLIEEWYPGDGDGLDSIALQDFRDAILAIEAEARSLVPAQEPLDEPDIESECRCIQLPGGGCGCPCHRREAPNGDLTALRAASPAPSAHPDEFRCGHCGDWMDLDNIEGHLNSEGRTLASPAPSADKEGAK